MQVKAILTIKNDIINISGIEIYEILDFLYDKHIIISVIMIGSPVI